MHIAINKICLRAALRFATFPHNHPLYPYIRRAAKTCPKKFPSPLHHTMDTFNVDPDTTKTILPIRQTTKWQPGIESHIASSLGRAMAEEALDHAYIKIFSDGSGIEGMIGAAAVLYRLTNGNQITKRVLRYCLGPETKHTVYKGEVVGEILAQHLLLNEPRSFGCHASMYINNQASIMATQLIHPAPGHHLLDILHDKVARTKKKHHNIRITAHWIPSHKEVERNKEADRQAKKAAKGDTDSPLHRLPAELRATLPDSKSAIQQVMTKMLKAEAAITLQTSPQWRKLRHVDPSMPSNRFRKLADHLPRKHATLLMQLLPVTPPLTSIFSPLAPLTPLFAQRAKMLTKPRITSSSRAPPMNATAATCFTNSIEAHALSPHSSRIPKPSGSFSSTSPKQEDLRPPGATWQFQTSLPPPQRAETEQI